ncbi:patatin-like phospholipase family protein [Curtobacterium ammoniigenes]|uniref:patatin-like phospholipase family protein n=1 Tax=Curtobacterium ammoniigenes TaxID=395387 RepID=UPI00082C9692|nr:patatin-like phospholipase family protein [Curtobacterium ammoniigenes]
MSIAPDPERSAIVFGGGGLAGIAWELGLLQGLLDEGIPLDDADLVVGTSAGSMVGAILRFGMVSQAFDQQLAPPPSSYVEPPALPADEYEARYRAALGAPPMTEQVARARIGDAASRVTHGPSDDERVATFAQTLPDAWPDAPLLVTAVDAEDGTFRTFSSGDDIRLPRAVAASCCVPFVWSPVRVHDRTYIDGGVRSVTNADVAAGCGRVLVIACRDEVPSPTGPALDAAVAAMRANGSRVEVVVADAGSQAAFGDNSLALSSQAPSAHAGRIQAGVVAERVRSFWLDADEPRLTRTQPAP